MNKKIKKFLFFMTFGLMFTCFFASYNSANAQNDGGALFTFTYERISTTPGDAEGTVTFVKNGDTLSDYYHLYWSDGSKKLEGYSMLASQKVKKSDTFTYSIPACTFIPKNATHLRAYSATGTSLEPSQHNETGVYAEIKLPEDIYASETKIYEFQVLSDTHIRSDSITDLHSERFINALNDIKEQSPNTTGIFINGDMVDNGYESEWLAYKNFITYVYGDTPPTIRCSIGNHESIHYESQTYDSMFELFSAFTGQTNPYLSVTINDDMFIMLSSIKSEADIREENYPNYYAYLGSDQLEWLDYQLAEAKQQGQNVFLFLHQPPKETVSGSFASRKQTWAGVVDDDELRAVIDKYPNVVMFTSHTHWHLESYGAMQYGEKTAPSFFNTASVAYLWSDEGAYATNGGQTYPGSQGLYVEVYSDHILVKGRDFENKRWISAAQFIIPIETKNKPNDNIVPSDSDTQKNKSCASGINSTYLFTLCSLAIAFKCKKGFACNNRKNK